MKVLKVSQECFMWLGIRLADSPTNRRWQILYTFLGWFSLLFLVLLVVSSSVVALNYGTNDLIKALAAAFPAVAAFRLFVSLISMVIYRQEVTLVFENLQTFCNQSKYKILMKVFFIECRNCFYFFFRRKGEILWFFRKSQWVV